MFNQAYETNTSNETSMYIHAYGGVNPKKFSKSNGNPWWLKNFQKKKNLKYTWYNIVAMAVKS